MSLLLAQAFKKTIENALSCLTPNHCHPAWKLVHLLHPTNTSPTSITLSFTTDRAESKSIIFSPNHLQRFLGTRRPCNWAFVFLLTINLSFWWNNNNSSKNLEKKDLICFSIPTDPLDGAANMWPPSKKLHGGLFQMCLNCLGHHWTEREVPFMLCFNSDLTETTTAPSHQTKNDRAQGYVQHKRHRPKDWLPISASLRSRPCNQESLRKMESLGLTT